VPIRIESCPSCSEQLQIRELHCPSCDITIRGTFAQPEPTPFARLNDEQEAFLRLFVLSRGNLSDVERSLGVSYPTVRAKLDDLIGALTDKPEPQPEPQPVQLSRTEILARVADGRLTTEEGMALLRQLQGEA
jgi:hypothetical protein